MMGLGSHTLVTTVEKELHPNATFCSQSHRLQEIAVRHLKSYQKENLIYIKRKGKEIPRRQPFLALLSPYGFSSISTRGDGKLMGILIGRSRQ
jgi:hypothetical protein